LSKLQNSETHKIALTNKELALYHELSGKFFLEYAEEFFEDGEMQDYLRVASKGNKDAQNFLADKLSLELAAARRDATEELLDNSKFSDSLNDRLDRANDEYDDEIEELERELDE
jgi:hypothetical protein